MAAAPSEAASDERSILFQKLGEKIAGLLDYIKLHSSVHGEIRQMAHDIRDCFDRVTDLEDPIPPDTVVRDILTSPSLDTAKKGKVKQLRGG